VFSAAEARERVTVHHLLFEHARIHRVAQRQTPDAATWSGGPTGLWLGRGLDKEWASGDGATEQIERVRRRRRSSDLQPIPGFPLIGPQHNRKCWAGHKCGDPMFSSSKKRLTVHTSICGPAENA